MRLGVRGGAGVRVMRRFKRGRAVLGFEWVASGIGIGVFLHVLLFVMRIDSWDVEACPQIYRSYIMYFRCFKNIDNKVLVPALCLKR